MEQAGGDGGEGGLCPYSAAAQRPRWPPPHALSLRACLLQPALPPQDPSQRDKIAVEMKKELKKLQRLREQARLVCSGPQRWRRTCCRPDACLSKRYSCASPGAPQPCCWPHAAPTLLACPQVRGWAASGDIKDDSRLTDARRSIERQMERFKTMEKELKIKVGVGNEGWEGGRVRCRKWRTWGPVQSAEPGLGPKATQTQNGATLPAHTYARRPSPARASCATPPTPSWWPRWLLEITWVAFWVAGR